MKKFFVCWTSVGHGIVPYAQAVRKLTTIKEDKNMLLATNFDKISTPVVDLIYNLLPPMLAIVGALGALYCVVLGVKYAKAEEPQDREKAKGALKNAIVGFVLIFVLLLGLRFLMPEMVKWVNHEAGRTVVNMTDEDATKEAE